MNAYIKAVPSSRALFLVVVIANTASVQYTYDKGNLSSVQRTNNGKSQTYGNGAVVSYTYDKLGRTKTATYDDGRVHNGTVIRHITERDNRKKCKQKS